MFDLRPLLTLVFWFDVTPDPFLPSTELILKILFGLVLFIGVAARFALPFFKKDPWHLKIIRKVSQCFLGLGALGWFLYWFSYEHFPFLSMRFWFFVWFIGAVVWGVTLVLYIVRTIPTERRAAAARKEREKYLP